ncbi:TetR/AcrR family transcriptional regulator [Kribbella qitaiheensis]|uniref:TetR/AcrR family transcriptional regulator n=1 Tax=Kribbella qitaiheensis TaxID=1544730 RepID=A0A7G6WZC0_9ACTN|nr:TetR/AcrR family transcriptional regulator [Kribbella qitaiheensis]QNE19335.1 TetR/AcrR family transcriptional regulator [Kribbella qitaiheensis]
MATRADWLDTGLRLLAEEGAPAVTIDRLTAGLGLSKGSYYHHFQGVGGFRTALLEHFETLFTTRLIDTVEEKPDTTAEVKLVQLMELVLAGPEDAKLEIAVRAWALQDGEARQAQERVDRARTQYLQRLCHGLESSLIDPDRLAELLYLILIGAEQVLPPVPSERLRGLYADTLRLATGRSLLQP